MNRVMQSLVVLLGGAVLGAIFFGGPIGIILGSIFGELLGHDGVALNNFVDTFCAWSAVVGAIAGSILANYINR